MHDLPESLEEFKDNLVDESVPEHRDAPSSSHDLPSEPRAKVVSGKHRIYIHFPKRPKLRHLLENQNYKGSLQTHWYGLAQSGKFWRYDNCGSQKFFAKDANLEAIIDTLQWYKTWQHSGYNHTHVKQNFPGDPEELAEVLGADEETKSHSH